MSKKLKVLYFLSNLYLAFQSAAQRKTTAAGQSPNHNTAFPFVLSSVSV